MKNSTAKVLIETTTQKFAHVTDPAVLLELLSKNEVVLLESADVVTKLGEKSMLFLDFALKLESRNNKVVVTLLVDEATVLFHHLREIFQSEIENVTENSFTISIDPLYHHLDLLEKMRARSALDVLRKTLASMRMNASAHRKNFMITGAFSYDFLDHFEKLPSAQSDVLEVPDYLFYVPLTSIVIDHKTKKTTIFAHGIKENVDDKKVFSRIKKREDNARALVEKSRTTQALAFKKSVTNLSYQVDIADEDFYELVSQCKEHILAGDVYQIVPSRTFSLPNKNPLLSYQALRHLNPSPYMFFMNTKSWTLFGASPETFIKVDKNGSRVSIRPIAGTRRRGLDFDGQIDDELDSREQASLCLDEKELAEHMMLVDLARNDIASVAKPKSRVIKRLLSVDRFSHVMHLVSEVEGTLLKGCDALLAYQASMNMGTLMGAPKVRAAELLRKLELNKRGFYGGAVGYLDLLGNMDTAIIIRSALSKNGVAHVRAGCGVVFDSTPQFETQETINKAEAVLRSIALVSEL